MRLSFSCFAAASIIGLQTRREGSTRIPPADVPVPPPLPDAALRWGASRQGNSASCSTRTGCASACGPGSDGARGNDGRLSTRMAAGQVDLGHVQPTGAQMRSRGHVCNASEEDSWGRPLASRSRQTHGRRQSAGNSGRRHHERAPTARCCPCRLCCCCCAISSSRRCCVAKRCSSCCSCTA